MLEFIIPAAALLIALAGIILLIRGSFRNPGAECGE